MNYCFPKQNISNENPISFLSKPLSPLTLPRSLSFSLSLLLETPAAVGASTTTARGYTRVQQRLRSTGLTEANKWHLTVNEKKFIENVHLSNLRLDGRRPLDYRNLIITFGKEDGSAEVQLGQTHVMGFVTGQLVQPYRDCSNEGSLSIFTELSPMADPSFEPGRPSEAAVELGRIIDCGLRESRAVDTESLCVLPGKLVWAIGIDLHFLDNGGNLMDTANIAALAALMTFRRLECSFGYLYVGFAVN
ncbi:exosome complex component RRP45B-like [Humulus lupulus]|uniref:exosome complex component RRP45B-like n=1 Tax=Humulus lupulus TaxID=3486 RepID=UPI002B40E755|nr:exosome complex component RRP45B-like [Humulus lupulus]